MFYFKIKKYNHAQYAENNKHKIFRKIIIKNINGMKVSDYELFSYV